MDENREFAALFLLFVAAVAAALLPGAAKDALAALRGGKSFREARDKIAENARAWGRFPAKFRFIDLNGGACRLAGRRICNRRIRFENGHIGEMYEDAGLSDPAVLSRAVGEVVDFSGELKSRGIPFVFVMAPRKMALEGRMFPRGWEGRNMNRDAMSAVESLERGGVRVLNLIPAFAATVADETANFFATDHHWRIGTAFEAARLAAGEIADAVDAPELARTPRLDRGNWEWRTLRSAFLGGDAYRTGRLFVPPEDFEYALPKFETDISLASRGGSIRARGDFRKSVVAAKRLRPDADATAKRYFCYGENLDVLRYVNHSPASPLRVMLVKDSFALPVAAFWSTVFAEVVVVDTRRFGEGVFLRDLVDACRPDVVVELVNPGFLAGHSLRLRPEGGG